MPINMKTKIIEKTFNDHIVPFDLSSTSLITLENSVLRFRIDKHDYNSCRIDVNLKEASEDMLDVFLSPISLAFQCLNELEKSNYDRTVQCYVSFE